MVSRTYHYVDFEYGPVTSGEYGTMLKQIVANLVSLCSELSINSVLVDTTSQYSVVLNCMNSEFRIFFRNNESTLYWGFLNKAGTEIARNGYGNILGTYTDYSTGTLLYRTAFRIQHSSIGGFINWFRIGNVTGGFYMDEVYTWGKSVELQSNIYCWNSQFSSGSLYTQTPTGVPSPLGSMYVYNSTALDGSYTYISWSSPQGPGTTACSYTGAGYYLAPISVYAWFSGTPKVYFGHILWGGLYDVYSLYSSSGSSVVTQADTQYAINGSVYLGCFSYMIIPEPAIFT